MGNCDFYRKFLTFKCQEVRVGEGQEVGTAAVKSAAEGSRRAKKEAREALWRGTQRGPRARGCAGRWGAEGAALSSRVPGFGRKFL